MHNGAGWRPPSRPTYPPPISQAPLARSLYRPLPPRCHSRGPHGNPVLNRIVFSSAVIPLPSVIMALGGAPPRDPLIPPIIQAPPHRPLSPRCHSRGPHGNLVLDRILDSRLLARMTAGMAASIQSDLLGPCPGIQFLIGKNRTGFPPSVRMTAGRGRVIPCVVRVFLFPSFSWPPRESSPRPHSGFPPSARMTAGRDGENDGGGGSCIFVN